MTHLVVDNATETVKLNFRATWEDNGFILEFNAEGCHPVWTLAIIVGLLAVMLAFAKAANAVAGLQNTKDSFKS